MKYLTKYYVDSDEWYPVYTVSDEVTEPIRIKEPWHLDPVELTDEEYKEYIQICAEFDRFQKLIRQRLGRDE